MNIANIKHFDIANGPGVRMSLFLSGCPFHCKGCFNEMTWNYEYGYEYNQEIENQIVNDFNDKYGHTGFSLLGGEPFARENSKDYQDLTNLINRLKTETNCDSFWVWSGRKFEDILKNQEWKDFLENFDVLVDGQFIEEEKNLTLPYCGSNNQRVIDVKKSIEKGEVVLWIG